MQRCTFFGVEIVAVFGQHQSHFRTFGQIRWLGDDDATTSDMRLEGLHAAKILRIVSRCRGRGRRKQGRVLEGPGRGPNLAWAGSRRLPSSRPVLEFLQTRLENL